MSRTSIPTDPVRPPRLAPGDQVRVVAPACSRAFVMEHDNTRWIDERFTRMGLRLTFGAHVDERDGLDSSSVASRVADLHEAFADPEVAAVLSVIGGSNSNELLPHLDWDLIAANPKIVCGYSDITALQNAIWARTGLITYSGPHWSSFGMRDHFEPTGDWFRSALFTEDPLQVRASSHWSDDLWFLDQDDREPRPNPGWSVPRPGRAEGRVIGGSLSTLALLQGTEWMPSLEGAVLFLEEDASADSDDVLRRLTSLLQQPGADEVRGLVLGRFQADSGIDADVLAEIIGRLPSLQGRPVITGVDFGHTNPQVTFPIGGRALVEAFEAEARIVITH